MENKLKPTIRDIFPELGQHELTEAEQGLNQYLALVLRIFEHQESETYPQADLLTQNNGTLGCTLPKEQSSERS